MSTKSLWTGPERQRKALQHELLFEHIQNDARPSLTLIAGLRGHETGGSQVSKVAATGVSHEVEMPQQSQPVQEVAPQAVPNEANVYSLDAARAARERQVQMTTELEPVKITNAEGAEVYDLEAIRRNLERVSSVHNMPVDQNKAA